MVVDLAPSAGGRVRPMDVVADDPGNRETERCAQCEFEWNAVPLSAIAIRLGESATQLGDLLRSSSAPSARPAADVWSATEHASHLGDVVINLRDRVIVGLAEDNPQPKPMHGMLRIERGMATSNGG